MTTRPEPTRALVALGSNIERERNLPAAARRLAEAVRIVRMSRLYDTEAVGPRHAPPFFNAAMEIEFHGTPEALDRALLKPIEAELGRVRTRDPNEPRTIDLDLVWWLGSGDGPPPDPEIPRYRHLAEPLAEIAPGLVHPTTGECLRDVASRLAHERADVRIEPVALPAWDRLVRKTRQASKRGCGYG